MSVSRADPAYLIWFPSGDAKAFLVGDNWGRTDEGIDVNGNLLFGKRLEPLEENLALNSWDIDTWTKVNLLTTPTVEASPFDELATRVTENVYFQNQFHSLQDGLITGRVASTKYLWGAYLKSLHSEREWMRIRIQEQAPTVDHSVYVHLVGNGAWGIEEGNIVNKWIQSLGDGWYVVVIQYVQQASTNVRPYLDAAWTNGIVYYKGGGLPCFAAIAAKYSTAIFPQSPIKTVSTSEQRASDSDLDRDIGTALSGARGSMRFRLLANEHVPDSSVELLHLTEDASNYLKCSITTSGYLQVDTAKTAGAAGQVVVEQLLTNRRLWEISIQFQNDYLWASVTDVETGTETICSVVDSSCDIAIGMETLELKPSGFLVGELGVWDDFHWGLSAVGIEHITVVARDVIKVSFDQPVAITESLLSGDTYQISTVDGSYDIEASVLPIVDGVNSETSSVLLALSPKAELGSSYRITIPAESLYDPDGGAIIEMTNKWLHHRTKVDSVLSSLSGLYDTTLESNLRMILQAITVSDEEIGGDF
jgi:hypothetical protein